MKPRRTPDEIANQRDLGWPDFHPEEYCHRCGRPNLSSWSVDSDRFNLAMAAIGLTSSAIVCPQCFNEGFEKATGGAATWHLTPSVWVLRNPGSSDGPD